jgi:hypothetical protein
MIPEYFGKSEDIPGDQNSIDCDACINLERDLRDLELEIAKEMTEARAQRRLINQDIIKNLVLEFGMVADLYSHHLEKHLRGSDEVFGRSQPDPVDYGNAI